MSSIYNILNHLFLLLLNQLSDLLIYSIDLYNISLLIIKYIIVMNKEHLIVWYYPDKYECKFGYKIIDIKIFIWQADKFLIESRILPQNKKVEHMC